MPDFFPGKWGDRLTWLQNLKLKLDQYATTLVLPAGKVAQIIALIDEMMVAIQLVVQREGELSSAVTARDDIVLVNDMPALRLELNALKTNTAMTPAIETDMKIVGTTPVFDPNTFKPDLSAEIVGGEIKIRFKKGRCEGVNIYTRLKGQTTWTKLSFDSHSPYVDNRPLANTGTPEVREYMAYGVLNDQQIGLQSDIVSVTFGG